MHTFYLHAASHVKKVLTHVRSIGNHIFECMDMWPSRKPFKMSVYNVQCIESSASVWMSHDTSLLVSFEMEHWVGALVESCWTFMSTCSISSKLTYRHVGNSVVCLVCGVLVMPCVCFRLQESWSLWNQKQLQSTCMVVKELFYWNIFV